MKTRKESAPEWSICLQCSLSMCAQEQGNDWGDGRWRRAAKRGCLVQATLRTVLSGKLVGPATGKMVKTMLLSLQSNDSPFHGERRLSIGESKSWDTLRE
jgi:hypothetical protein